jgi:hypothetical protein
MNPFKGQLNKLRAELTPEEAKVKTIETYKKVFGTAEGKFVLMDLLDRSTFFNPPVAGKTATDYAFSAGSQSVIAGIIEILNIDIGLFFNSSQAQVWVNEEDVYNVD